MILGLTYWEFYMLFVLATFLYHIYNAGIFHGYETIMANLEAQVGEDKVEMYRMGISENAMFRIVIIVCLIVAIIFPISLVFNIISQFTKKKDAGII